MSDKQNKKRSGLGHPESLETQNGFIFIQIKKR